MSIAPTNGTSPAAEKEMFSVVPSDIKMKLTGISPTSSISSQPVEAAYMGNVKRLSPLQRFALGQERDQNHLPTFPFKCPSIPLNEVENFIKGDKESLLVLGESVHQSLEEISGEYLPFYVDLAQVKNPEKALEGKLYEYGFNWEEIKQFRRNYKKLLIVFYNCYPKANCVHPNLSYKNEIFKLWHGKLISFCVPFNLPGSPRESDDCFMHIESGRSYPERFVCYESLGLSDEEIQAALDEHLSPNALQFVQQMKVMVPGFWELLRTRSLLHALIQILPTTFKEMTINELYDTWMTQWFATREKETKIEDLEKGCRKFLSKLAKAMEQAKLTEVWCAFLTQNKWDNFFYPEDDDNLNVCLRNSPLYKIDNRYGFLPSLQHYFATGNVQTVPGKLVDVYYV